MGIPWSVFTGRVVDSGEPLWTEDDTQLALAYVADKAKLKSEVCPGCGQELALTTAKEHRDSWKVEVVSCSCCKAIGRMSDDMQKDASGSGESVHGAAFKVSFDPWKRGVSGDR